MKRHCLRIPFLIGQRDDSIIGSACADNPVWTVPCDDLDLGGADCWDGILLGPADPALTLPPDDDRVLVLTAPDNVTVLL